jgi:hypothetical protein
MSDTKGTLLIVSSLVFCCSPASASASALLSLLSLHPWALGLSDFRFVACLSCRLLCTHCTALDPRLALCVSLFSVSGWTTDEVWQWLEAQDYSSDLQQSSWKYTDGETLLTLTLETLGVLGVPSTLAPRLLKDVRKLGNIALSLSLSLSFTLHSSP